MNNYEIIFIVGLPASGKTTLSKSLEGYLILDEFITTTNNEELINIIKTNDKICLIDSRLCKIETFLFYYMIAKMLTRYIKIIVFRNEPLACINNIYLRHSKKEIIKLLIEYMWSLSKSYDINLYEKICNDNIEIHDVFKKIDFSKN